MPTFPTLTIPPTYPLDEQREDATIRSSFEAGTNTQDLDLLEQGIHGVLIII